MNLNKPIVNKSYTKRPFRSLLNRRRSHSLNEARGSNGFTTRFPEIALACEKLPPETLIDGEVVAIDDTGRVSFNAFAPGRPFSSTLSTCLSTGAATFCGCRWRCDASYWRSRWPKSNIRSCGLKLLMPSLRISSGRRQSWS